MSDESAEALNSILEKQRALINELWDLAEYPSDGFLEAWGRIQEEQDKMTDIFQRAIEHWNEKPS